MKSQFINYEQRALPLKMLIFVEVVRLGSFTAAAEALRLTKSGVSQHISRLESELNVQLLTRTTRNLTLTEPGRVFWKRCQEMQSLLARTLDELQDLQQRPQGAITVTAPNAFLENVVVPAISDLTQAFPDLTPRILIDDEPLDLIKHGINVAIRVGSLGDSTMRAKTLGRLNNVFVASPTYLDTDLASIDIEKLSECAFIATSWQDPDQSEQLVTTDQREVSVKLDTRYQVNTVHAAAQLAMLGRGIALLPNIYVNKMIVEGKLRRVCPTIQSQSRNIWSVHNYGNEVPLKIRKFVDLVALRLQSQNIVS